jgi:hypothetical protein
MLFGFLNSIFAVNRKHLFAVVIASAVWFLYTAIRYRRARADRPVPWTVYDSVLTWLIALFGVTTALFLFLAPPLRLPAEDPAILFQFSQTLAHTGSITYFPHGPRAEGATDFAWMVLIAIGIKLHLDPLWTVGIINLASLISLPLLLARIANQRPTPIAFLVVIGGYGLLPQAAASIVGFSVLPFACLLVLVMLCFLRQYNVGLCLSSLLLCLFRPDGVVFALPIQIAALIVYPDRRPVAAAITGCFTLPGVAYFVWRWHYFHSLLPLPFLVKSDALRVAHLFVVHSVETGALLCAFAFTLAWIALQGQGKLTARTRAVVLCILVLPNLFYFAMRLDQNAGHRFFIYLPIGAAVVTAMEWQRICANRAVILRSWVAVWLVFVCGIWLNDAERARDDQADNRAAIAKDLSHLQHGTLIVTEAGVLPYYSGWITYDAWGLNTAQFARRLFQPGDVNVILPDALLVYAGETLECTPDPSWSTPYTTRTWQHLTRNMVAGAGDTYELWYAPFGSVKLRELYGVKTWQGLQECWLLRRSSPLLRPMEEVLTRHDGLPASQFYAVLQAELAAGQKPDVMPSVLSRVSPELAALKSPPEEHRDLLHIVAHRPYRTWFDLSQ